MMKNAENDKKNVMRISTPFLPMPMAVAYDTRLNNTEKLLLADIFYFRHGPYFKTNSLIGKILGISTDRAVLKVISGLVQKGVLKREIQNKNKVFFRRYLWISDEYYKYIETFDAEKAVYGDIEEANGGGPVTPSTWTGNPVIADIEPRHLGRCTPSFGTTKKNNIEEELRRRKENIYISHQQTFDKVAETIETDNKKNNISTKRKERKQTALPIPTLEEVEEWAAEKGSTKETAMAFYRYWDACEWKDRRGVKLKNWHRNFATWLANESKFEERQGTRRGTVNGIPHAPGLESFNKTDEEILRDLHNFGNYK